MRDFVQRDSFIKICGITNVPDAKDSVARGASALGMVLSESKRNVTPDTAATIVDAVRGTVLCVGVVRNETTEFVVDCVDTTRVDVVQVHGILTDELRRELHRRGVGIIKALGVSDEEFLTFDERDVDAVLIDGPTPGSGENHSWRELEARTFEVPIIAAGGLTPDNVKDVIRRVGPWGVDVATGVELSAGLKDLNLVAAFITNAANAFSKEGSK